MIAWPATCGCGSGEVPVAVAPGDAWPAGPGPRGDRPKCQALTPDLFDFAGVAA